MTTDREIALEQALVAVLAAAETTGADVKRIIDTAGPYIFDSGSPYNTAGNSYSSKAVQEISDAHAEVLTRKNR